MPTRHAQSGRVVIEMDRSAGDNPARGLCWSSNNREHFFMSRDTLREAAAEFLGTFTLIVFGVGVVAQVVLGRGGHGDWPRWRRRR